MRKRFQLGLVGWPLAHSISPALHHAALEASKLRGMYELFPVAPLPDGQAQLQALLQRMRTGALHGLNVTLPYKQSVLALLDALTPTAQAAGAVNTILCAGTCLVGENTDVFGFSEDLKQHVPESNPGHALVLGAGGGARAVVYALASQGWQVFVAARQPGQAQTLAASFAQLQPAPIPMTQGLPEAATDLGRLNVRLIVNATPLGMPPHDHSSPWPAEVQLPEGCFVYDLVYHPQETVLLRQAKARGLKCTNGLGMLVRQAAQAFTIWTNLPLECLPVVQEAMQHASVNGREY